MKMRTWLGLSVCSVLLAGPALAEEPSAAGDAHKAMMDAWMAASAPGTQHLDLAKMAGTWDTVVKSWMDPAAPPTESKGISEMKMILGGRYLHQSFKGEMMGMPYEGMGYTGYDNVQKKYIGVWFDNMGTGMMNSVGDFDPDTKKMVMKGTAWDAMTGAICEFDEVITLTDNDHQVFEMWAPGPDGKKFKNMEIHYTRKM